MTHLAYIDIDGVMADERHRQHFILDGDAPDWPNYFALPAISQDGVWPEGKALFEHLKGEPDTEVWFLTGRRIDLHEVTETWFLANGFGYVNMAMKPMGLVGGLDKFKAAQVQADWESGLWETITVYDDDQRVIKAIEALANPALKAVFCGWHTKPERMLTAAKA